VTVRGGGIGGSCAVCRRLCGRAAKPPALCNVLPAEPHSTAPAIGAPLLAELLHERGRFEEVEGLLIERMPTIDADAVVLALRNTRTSHRPRTFRSARGVGGRRLSRVSGAPRRIAAAMPPADQDHTAAVAASLSRR
jgi:hypothetical protein